MNIEEVFWKRVNKTETCWLWVGATTTGYGLFKCRPLHVTMRAHRQAWLLVNGSIPLGLFVCHKCDTPLCVRPDHLFLGTNDDNVADMMAKGRNYVPPNGVHPAQATAAHLNATACRNGHPYTEKTTARIQRKGGMGRYCKICRYAAQVRFRARKASAS